MTLIRRKKLPIKSTMVKKKKRRPNAKSLSDLIDMDKQKTDRLTPMQHSTNKKLLFKNLSG